MFFFLLHSSPPFSATFPLKKKMDEKYRHALTKFYEKYEPKKVKTVEALLEKYSGQEEELLFALAKKYDPERDAASIVDELLTEVSTPVGETQPSQAEDVEDNHADIADSFRESAIVAERKPLEAGKEELVMGSPNPRAPAENAYRKELIQLYEKYSPSRVANVDKELNKYSGREEALIAAVKKRYVHDEPPTEEENYRQKLLNLYNTFAPSKAHKVDFYLTKYRGREGSLLAAAEAKFLKQASDLHEAAEAARKEGDYHNRLKAVYEEYAPQRIPKVDHDLQKYPGREEEVIQAAIKKFGGAESDEGYPTENDDDEKKEEQAKPTVEVTPVEEHITHEEQPKPAVEVTPMEESAPHQESKTTVEVTPVEEHIRSRGTTKTSG
ncbi:hypothetical protein AGDE_15902 [Angomonas deanei]|uniref:Uncharacterized protein n=1 Tax=Angomonas deanei TaxID=59799 RepID=A0A7G2C884_9TRYP|nr:hypothetical protein AGDE_15902 [Angomonas deanei]CAD2215304.1 hypothetical protein, conserved [Angomonas deanei]|eukprot:EPY18182.1 hypothetical protein AGDE_15902 [Angomonas deanei]